jgi:hypothetical protein
LAGTIAVVMGEAIPLGIFLTPAAMAKSLGFARAVGRCVVRHAALE